MNLEQIIRSSDWNAQIKEEFFIKLRRSPTAWHKGQNIAVKAYSISSNKPNEALELLDYGIELCKKANATDILGRILSVKGSILEYQKHDYLEAYKCYTKWAKLKSVWGGHEIARLRSLFRYKKLKVDDEFLILFNRLKDKMQPLPSRDVLFWLNAMTSSAYEYDGLPKKTSEFAIKALNIYVETGQSLLQLLLPNFSNLQDEVNVTNKELRIIASRILPVKSVINNLKPKKIN